MNVMGNLVDGFSSSISKPKRFIGWNLPVLYGYVIALLVTKYCLVLGMVQVALINSLLLTLVPYRNGQVSQPIELVQPMIRISLLPYLIYTVSNYLVV
jgi:hypothetical protein